MIPSLLRMSSRPVPVDSEYSIFDVLLQDDGTLVSDAIRRITPDGIETVDGVEHAVDVIVSAAAFAAAEVGLDITPTDQACAVAALNAAAPTGRLAPTWQRINRAWADNDIALPPELTDLRRRLATPV